MKFTNNQIVYVISLALYGKYKESPTPWVELFQGGFLFITNPNDIRELFPLEEEL